MHRATLNYLVDFLTLLLILGLICTGLILEFVLLPGTGGREGGAASVLWGETRHGWGDIHFYIAMGLGALLALHIALHWAWVCAVTRRIVGSGPSHSVRSRWHENAAGAAFVAALALLIGGFVFIAQSAVKIREAPQGSMALRSAIGEQDDPAHEGHAEVSGVEIRGSMTLAEIAQRTGTDLTRLRISLGLPQAVSADEKLGQLRKEYGFTMSEAREAIRLAATEAKSPQEPAP